MKTYQNIAKLTCWIILVSTLQSCYSVYHFDAAEYFKTKESNKEMPFSMKAENINAPLFAPEQKINLSGSLAFKGGGDIRIGFRPTDHLMMMFNYSSLKNISMEESTAAVGVTTYQDEITDPMGIAPSNTVVEESTEYISYIKENTLKQTSYELAAGYIKEFAKGGQWDVLAGGGKGTAENSWYYYAIIDPSQNTLFTESRDHIKLYLQSDIGYVTKLTEGSVSARFSYLKFSDRKFTMPYEIIQNAMDPSAFTFQPGFHFGFGNKNIRAFTDYSFIIPLNHTEINWKNSSVTLGCAIKF